MKTPSAAPRATTLVSPVTMDTPAVFAASAMERVIDFRSSMGNPSSRMNPALNISGIPPQTERSLMVPWTAIDPMFPPGKKIGSIT
ncbi:MAG: hypothetical protein A4E73_00361 [Syntrophaceae bacterium PtaU1.Bin231]|nr:MAG: hypothetical protein A4E73_00361 [Syntrophaceae bacterium PtaU1.Bin231]